MKKAGFIFLAALLIPTIYEGRKYYVYNKMVEKYKRKSYKKKVNFFNKILKVG